MSDEIRKFVAGLADIGRERQGIGCANENKDAHQMTDQLTKLAEECTDKIQSHRSPADNRHSDKWYDMREAIHSTLQRAVELERERLKPWVQHIDTCNSLADGHSWPCSCGLDELRKQGEEE